MYVYKCRGELFGWMDTGVQGISCFCFINLLFNGEKRLERLNTNEPNQVLYTKEPNQVEY